MVNSIRVSVTNTYGYVMRGASRRVTVGGRVHLKVSQFRARKAMDSDVEMDIDAVAPSASKGKEKAEDICVSSDTLPWYVPSGASLAHIIICSPFRVEKYRPVTLNDVVSHKDITTTSERRV